VVGVGGSPFVVGHGNSASGGGRNVPPGHGLFDHENIVTVCAMTEEIAHQRVSMPGRVKATLAILAFQILANGFIGYVILDAVSERESHGAKVPNAGFINFIGYVSFVIAVMLLVCAVLTSSRFAWIRPTVITIEVIGAISSVINLVSGQLTAVIGFVLAAGIINMLNRDEVRDWYNR
jgi:hypothetical protein